MSNCSHNDPECYCISDYEPSAVIGKMVLQNPAYLDTTGSTRIKLMLHADGSVTWRPLFGTAEDE